MQRKLKIFVILFGIIIILGTLVGIMTPILFTNKTVLSKIASMVMPKPKTVKNPTKGIATIKSTQQTNSTRNLNGHLFYEMKILVDVAAEESEKTWPAEMQEFVPVEIISRLQPGTKLQILYNAKDPSQVVIPDGNFIIGN